MSTANFSSPNLSCVYAIGMNDYDFEEVKKDIAECNDIPLEDISDTRVEDYISDCQREDYEYTREEIEKDIDKTTDFTLIYDKYINREKTWFARAFIEFYDRKYKEWDTVTLYATVESWYYEWVQFDIDISHDEDTPWAKTKIARLKKQLEKVYAKHCLKLRKAYQFSNWEAGYSIIK